MVEKMGVKFKEKIKIIIKVNPLKCPYYRVDEEGKGLCEFKNYIAVNPPGIVLDTVIDVEGEEIVKREHSPYLALSFILTNYPLYKDRIQPCNPEHCFGRRMPLLYQLMMECFKSGMKRSIIVTEEIPEKAVIDFINLLRRNEEEQS